jgi:hypothetical protein
MEENKIYSILEQNEWIAADLGYRGLQHDFPRVAFPYPDNCEIVTLNEKQLKFNSEFKRIRTVVENVIQYIKKWKVCKYVFRSSAGDIAKAQEEHHRIWVVAAGLVNMFVMPCRFLHQKLTKTHPTLSYATCPLSSTETTHQYKTKVQRI